MGQFFFASVDVQIKINFIGFFKRHRTKPAFLISPYTCQKQPKAHSAFNRNGSSIGNCVGNFWVILSTKKNSHDPFRSSMMMMMTVNKFISRNNPKIHLNEQQKIALEFLSKAQSQKFIFVTILGSKYEGKNMIIFE